MAARGGGSGSTLLEYSVEDAARAIESGETDAPALLEAFLQRYDETKFFFMLTEDFTPVSARERCKEAVESVSKLSDTKSLGAPGKVLAGVPTIISDTIDVKGLCTSAGNVAMRDWRAERDAEVVAKLRQAGAWVMGKGSVHDLGVGLTCLHTPKGAIVNPFSIHGGVTGGHAGGAAAAVAARLVPFALGVDSSGDVRLPAHCCGVVGFRPTWGRYSLRGVLRGSGVLDSVGVFARQVSDIQLLDAVLCAPLAPELAMDGDELAEAELAATRIQAIARGRVTRRRMKGGDGGEKSPPPRSSPIPPTGGEEGSGVVGGGETEEEKEGEGEGDGIVKYGDAERLAATRIQAAARGKLARTQTRASREAAEKKRQEEAAVRLQAIARGRATRSRFEGVKDGMGVEAVRGPLAGLRLGVPEAAMVQPADPSVAHAFHTATTMLRNAGAQVVRVRLAFPAAVIKKARARPAMAPDAVIAEAASAADLIRGYERLRELGLFLASHKLDEDREVVVETPAKKASDDDEDEEDGDDEDAPKGPKVEIRRTVVSSLLEAFRGSEAEREELQGALDEVGRGVDTSSYLNAVTQTRGAVLQALSETMRQRGLHAIIYPTALAPAAAVRGEGGAGVWIRDTLQPISTVYGRNTCLAAVAGAPAITVPCGLARQRSGPAAGNPGSERVPVGMEFCALPGQDQSLLRIAAEAQKLFPEAPDPLLRRRWAKGVDRKIGV